MIVIPGRIPIIIHPLFWFTAALIGWLNTPSLLGMVIWVGIILLSVLFHEFGHALMAVIFKQKAEIQLIAMGGVTSFNGPSLRFWQQFLIVFNGPLFGFFLFLACTLCLLGIDRTHSPTLYGILKMGQIANLFWSVVNLFPVLPLDGGQLLRILLEASFGVKGFRASLLVGALLAGALSFYFFLLQAFLIGALFFLFAFQSFESWRKARRATKSDREEKNKEFLLKAEEALQEGRKEEAKQILEEAHAKVGEGLLSSVASQYLAFLYVEEGKKKEAYQLLLPIKEQLTEEGKALLHRLAAEEKNYSLVAELSADVYQVTPEQEVALRNARAFAHLGQAEPAGGWLQTAWQYGGLDLERVLKEEEFYQVKKNKAFQTFVEPLKS